MNKLLAAFAALLALSTAASGQTFPSKPLRLICPFPPAGAVDIASRATARELQTGTADSKALRIQAARAFRGDFTPGFYPRHLVKDITLAMEEADSLGIDLRGLKTVRARWLELLYKFPQAKSIQDLARLYM